MREPSLVVGAAERDSEGRLRAEHLVEIRIVLSEGGFILLPSDTSYSIAAWLNTVQIRDDINTMLDRPDEPISMAFSSVEAVKEWTEPNLVADRLLERFTPGPITVVRRASSHLPDNLTRKVYRSQNRTIGVRIPNSVEERQVASVTKNQEPVTTVAVRIGKDPVTSFEEADGLVRAGLAKLRDPAWCAIEGTILYQTHSTVVEVLGESGSYRLIRHGDIAEEDIRACIEGL